MYGVYRSHFEVTMETFDSSGERVLMDAEVQHSLASLGDRIHIKTGSSKSASFVYESIEPIIIGYLIDQRNLSIHVEAFWKDISSEIVVNWNAVSQAKEYELSIYDMDSQITSNVITTETNYTFPATLGKTYVITTTAIVNGEKSRISDPVTVTLKSS